MVSVSVISNWLIHVIVAIILLFFIVNILCIIPFKQQILGYGNVLGILLGVFFAFTAGSLIGCLTYLFMDMINETSLYHILFINNDAPANASCDWNSTGLVELNRSEFKALLYHRSDLLTVKLLVTVAFYMMFWALSQTAWIVTMFKLVNNIRAGFLRELFSKSMAWYDVFQPAQLAFYLTE